jgi:oligo-1,6-glucosidase
MHREVLAHYDVMTVGECHFVDPARGARYAAESRHELSMLFQFDQIFSGGDRARLRRAIESWYAEFRRQEAWTTITLGNHDFPRLVSVFGDDSQHRDSSAKLFATLLLTAPGTPFLYQGDEIGMTNVRRERADQYDDIQSLGQYRENVARGMPEAEALALLRKISRDNARTPLQWSDEPGAGFGSSSPWLAVNPNYRELNVAQNERDPGSILNFYRRLIELRKREPALVYGEFTPLSESDTPYVYSRRLGTREFVVILNWAGEPARLSVDGWLDPDTAELVVSNLAPPALHATLELAPWQASVYRTR